MNDIRLTEGMYQRLRDALAPIAQPRKMTNRERLAAKNGILPGYRPLQHTTLRDDAEAHQAYLARMEAYRIQREREEEARLARMTPQERLADQLLRRTLQGAPRHDAIAQLATMTTSTQMRGRRNHQEEYVHLHAFFRRRNRMAQWYAVQKGSRLCNTPRCRLYRIGDPA